MVAYDNYSRRIPTGELNRLLRDCIDARPYTRKGRELKIYYGTMSRVKPPTITIFVNDTEMVHFSYERYILNSIRKQYGFAGTPLVLRVRRAQGELDPLTGKKGARHAR